jgi:predicted alpha/beta superfamily hydrolase
MSGLVRRLTAAFALSLVASLSGAGGAAAQEDGAPVSIGTYRLINSKILGETRRLLVYLPRGYEGSAITYPVIYHTYGDYLTYFADAYTALERLGDEARAPQLILVGIDNIDRYRDLRPLQRDGSPAGIDNYTRFLTDEVIPFVEKEYRTAGYRILAGPQAGAVFGLYTIQNDPGLFDAFILNNPFTNRPNARLLLEQAEQFYVSRESLQKFLFITYGGSGESPQDVADVERFAGLAAPARDKGLDLRLNDISGNDEFIVPLCLKEGLRELFAPYYVPSDHRFQNLAEINAFYSGLSGKFGYDVAPSEWVMTRSADALIAQKDYAKAVEILVRQTSLYPNMLNGWWRLAGIAAEQGDSARAIELYRKCVEINPSVRNFVERRINALEHGES